VLGRPIWDVLLQVGLGENRTSAAREQNKQISLDFLNTGQAPWLHQLQEDEILRSDGSRRMVQFSVFGIQTDLGYRIGSTIRDVTKRVQAEKEREELIADLEEALASIKTLRGLIPICVSCKKIRDDEGYWNQVEVYIAQHSEAEFTHGICPDCKRELYPGFYESEK
jgi:hypothetical protein